MGSSGACEGSREAYRRRPGNCADARWILQDGDLLKPGIAGVALPFDTFIRRY
jgi:hypothetical protein